MPPIAMFLPLVILLVAGGVLGWRWLKLNQLDKRRPADAAAWDLAISQQESQVNQLLLTVSRPVAQLPAIKDLAGSDEFEQTQARLLAGGGTFGGSIEVFLAVQATSLMIGMCLAILGVLGDFSTPVQIMLLLFALALSAYPADYVKRRANERGRAVDSSLPEFAQFLNMSLSAGRSPNQALEFTAARVEGPVSEEVLEMLKVLRTKEMNTEDAYMLAAYRLGTPLSYQFMVSLMKASQEGKKLTETLRAQANAVRTAVYQRRRSDAKKLPNTLTIYFFMHMMPLLFAVVLTPAVHAFAQI